VPSNIAEGDERDTDREAVRFFYIAKGSLAELRTQVEIGKDVGVVEKGVGDELLESTRKISGMLCNFIKVRKERF
jgi:four helix bundle protein